MPDQLSSATIFSFPERPEDRLRRALRNLEAALAEQAAAVAGLRAELGSLSGALVGLEVSMSCYAGELGRSADAAGEAHAAALALEAAADRLLAITGT